MKAKVLAVDDEPVIVEILTDQLRKQGLDVITAANGEEALEQIKREGPDIVLLDLQMPKMSGMEVLEAIERERFDVTVIVITAYGTVDKAVEAMKLGAFDFLTKPFDVDHIRVVINKALERDRLQKQNEILRHELRLEKRTIVSQSDEMKGALDLARRAADSNSTVLILGESGTGKELIARAVHDWSPRRDHPFVAVNCVALSEELLVSELFGHEKGAFTGADRLKKGRLEVANGGTVFLDEIGDMKPELQAKLLRFLQEKEFERVGGNKSVSVDVRVLAATNQDIRKAVKDGRFREDLYFRLNVVSITLPPLRDRKDDIEPMANYFLEKYREEAKRDVRRISDEAMKILKGYDWPGNARELENVIERAVVLSNSEEIRPEELPDEILEAQFGRTEMTSADAPAAITRDGKILPFHESVVEYKRRLIRETLNQTGGNQVKASAILELQPTYLSKLMKNLGLR